MVEPPFSKFPEGCDGIICPECEPYGCSFLPGSRDLQGNIIEEDEDLCQP